MAARPALLFVSESFPFPFDRGQAIRVHHLVAACAQQFDVSYLGPRPARPSDEQLLRPLCRELLFVDDTAPPASWSAWWQALRAAPGMRRPRTVRDYLRYTAALESIDLDAFDLVWCERLPMARLFLRRPGERTIVDLDDLEHVKLRRKLRLRQPAAGLPRDLYRYLLYRRAELRTSRRFRAAVVCSDDDRRYLEASGSRNVLVIPNGTRIDPQAPRVRRTAGDGVLRTVFLGNLGYAPNVDALEHYVHAILPRIRRQADARLEVIGPGAPPGLAARLGPHAALHGYVDDLDTALAACDVFVVPLRFGGGTKLKVLDALARRVPLVTSRIGAEGLGLVHGHHALIADTPEAFAEAVLQLARDPALCAGLAEAGYRLVRSRYSWSAICNDAARRIAALLPRPAPAAGDASGAPPAPCAQRGTSRPCSSKR